MNIKDFPVEIRLLVLEDFLNRVPKMSEFGNGQELISIFDVLQEIDVLRKLQKSKKEN